MGKRDYFAITITVTLVLMVIINAIITGMLVMQHYDDKQMLKAIDMTFKQIPNVRDAYLVNYMRCLNPMMFDDEAKEEIKKPDTNPQPVRAGVPQSNEQE